MAKSQHGRHYRTVPSMLRKMREGADLTQRDLGGKLNRPQSWIYNSETGNRRVDVAEFVLWCRACGEDPRTAIASLSV